MTQRLKTVSVPISGSEKIGYIISSSSPSLIDWDQLPDWQRDNEYLLSGYRPASYSYWESLRSVLCIHNETVNIHSHLFGAAIFFTAPYFTYQAVSTDQATGFDWPDIIVFSTFFFGVAICFLLSSTFHIFANHSPRVNVFGNQLDYLGIIILMWGSTIPSVYYGFYCDAHLRNRYWGLVSLLAAACIITTFNARFRHPSLRPYRALMYAGLGFSALGFVTHGLYLYGFKVQKQRMSLDWMGYMAILNLIGAATYSLRLPEKAHPRRFDIVGCSHQILHCMVILAALAHMFGLFRPFGHTHDPAFSCKL